ncbi:MAG: hypothetical protein ACHQ2Y_03605 [Candidatus Lutacidiplasmatales archaeon]
MQQDPVRLPGSVPRAATRSMWTRLLAFLRSHPILCLFLLTPGMVEYLSGSSALANIVLNPVWFVLQLGFNAAMYLPGALLVREAMIRWNKGWPTAFALGGAYAIMEEGIADQTILNPFNSPIGGAGVYGHYLGINWLWLPDVLLIHILMSICVPILLLDYALPEIRGKSLLSGRGVVAAVAVISVDTALLGAVVVGFGHYWYGVGLLVACIGAIVALIVLGYVLPKHLFPVRPGAPTRGPTAFFLLGAFVYPLMVVAAAATASRGASPLLGFLAVVAVPLVFLWVFVRSVGSERNVPQLVAFSGGLMVLGVILGVATQFTVPLVLLADISLFVFLRWLYRSHRDPLAAVEGPPNAVPAHAM